jgi:hypothetical protein
MRPTADRSGTGRRVALLALLLLVVGATLLIGATAEVAAQAGNNSSSGPPTPNADAGGVRIDKDLAVISAEMQDGEAVIVLYADSSTPVQLIDAAWAAYETGENIAATGRVVVDGRQTFRMDIRSTDSGQRLVGMVYGINSKRTVVWIDRGGDGGNPFEEIAPSAAWIGGTSCAFSMFVLAGYLHLRRRDVAPRSGWPTK